MKKLKKYSTDVDHDSGSLKLESYLQKSKNLLSSGSSLNILSKKNIPLAGLVPLVAASLAPVAISAQCGNGEFLPSNSVLANVAGMGGNEMTIDVDDDGNIDFEIDISLGTAGGGMASFGDLFLQPKNGAEVLCYPVAMGYFYVNKFNTNDAITSASTTWKNAGSLIGGQCTMDFQANGPWDGAGTVTGYVGFRLPGSRLGFMEVIYESGVDVTVNATLTGVQSVQVGPLLSSVNAGVCSMLPVELSRFVANTNGDKVNLEWTTESETNNEGFEIQRSINGRDFAKVDWIKGQGNTLSAIDYEYTDKISYNTQYYYRLKQIDYDGEFSYSKIQSVISKDNSGLIVTTISPNPAQESINVQFESMNNSDVQFMIFDIQGRIVKSASESQGEGKHSINLNIEELQAGSYFLKMQNEDNVTYEKFIKN